MDDSPVKLEQNPKRKEVMLISLGLGVIIGAFLAFSPGTLFVIILAGFSCLFVLKYLPPSERRFVKWVFIIGLALRMVVVVSLDVAALVCFKEAAMQKVEENNPPDTNYRRLIREKTRSFFKMSDSDYYSMRGYVYAAHFKGLDNIIIRRYLNPTALGYGWSAYLYIIGLFYYLFDYSPVAVKFLNCLIGVLGAVFIYKIGLNFNKQIARIAFLTTMFVPSLIIWSTANLKEPILIMLSGAAIWASIVFLKTKEIQYLAIPPLAIFMQFCFSKTEIWLVLLASILLSFIAMLSLRKKIILISLFLIICIIGPKNISIQDFPSAVRKTALSLYANHIGNVNTGGSIYRVLNDKYYSQPGLLYEIRIGEFVASAIKSIIHFLFEPFPSRMANLSFLPTYIQMLLWYLLLFFACVGFVKGKIYGYESYLPLLFYTILGTGIMALASGNVGTLFRHRDIFSPFYFLFAAVGIAYLFRLGNQNNEQKHEVV